MRGRRQARVGSPITTPVSSQVHEFTVATKLSLITNGA